jgi:3-deoxy-D-manno-octulosonic acid (KDO) 8-phosphate synthase
MTLQYNQLTNNHFLVAGPCVIESAELLDEVAAELKEIASKLPFIIIFKASFDKANRTSINSFRGPGMEKGLQMLADIKSKYGFPLLSDIHESYQAAYQCQKSTVFIGSGYETCRTQNRRSRQQQDHSNRTWQYVRLQ